MRDRQPVTTLRGGPTSHSCFAQRLRLHYVDWGNESAPPLVLVHGNRDHCRNWDWVAERMRERYHILAPDFRGHGDSEWVRGSGYSHTEYVYDLAQVIHQQGFEQQGWPKVTLIAHSLGGGVALRYAGAFPERIEKLVVIEGWGGPPEWFEPPPPHERLRQWISAQREVSGRLPRRYADVDEALARMQDANPHLSDEQARHLTRQGANQNEDGTWSWKFDNYTHVMAPFDMTRADTLALWRRIEAPVLLVSGSESWMARERKEDPVQHFRNARHVIVPDAGHWVHHDQLDAFLGHVEAFLAGP